MRILFLLFLLSLTGQASADGIEITCTDSPQSAVLKVPQPADRFLHVLCTKYGHILTPTVGWFWTQPSTYNPLFFPAQMVRDNPSESNHHIHFTSITVSALSSEAAQEKWSVLSEMFPKDPVPNKALEVTATNNMGEAHKIYIFPDAWGYSCSPSCRKENAFIMISEKKELPEW